MDFANVKRITIAIGEQGQINNLLRQGWMYMHGQFMVEERGNQPGVGPIRATVLYAVLGFTGSESDAIRTEAASVPAPVVEPEPVPVAEPVAAPVNNPGNIAQARPQPANRPVASGNVRRVATPDEVDPNAVGTTSIGGLRG